MASSPRRFAVVIGVNDYSTYAEATGKPSDACNLKGAVADAREWARLARSIGTAPKDLRLLTSPRLPRSNDAARAEILDAVTWLAGQLGADAGAVGLLVFAGHGAYSSEALYLCPTDTGANRANAIAFSELEEIFARLAPSANLWTVLETCHAAAGDGARSLGGEGAAPLTALRLPGAVLAASGTGGRAYEVPFSRGVRGAFSFAAEAVLQRFEVVGGGEAPFGLSGTDLVSRVEKFLRALGLRQRPSAQGGGLATRSGVCAPIGRAAASGGWGRLLTEELWPDTNEPSFQPYDVKIFSSNNATGSPTASNGVLIVIGSQSQSGGGGHTFQANRSYWYFPTNGSSQKVNPLGLTSGSFAITPILGSFTLTSFDPHNADTSFAEADFSGTSSNVSPTPSNTNPMQVSVVPTMGVNTGYLAVAGGGQGSGSSLTWTMKDPANTVGDPLATPVLDALPTLVVAPLTPPSSVVGWQVTDGWVSPS